MSLNAHQVSWKKNTDFQRKAAFQKYATFLLPVLLVGSGCVIISLVVWITYQQCCLHSPVFYVVFFLFQKDALFLLPVLLVGSGGVMIGLTAWIITGQHSFLLQQILCFVGQAAVPFTHYYGFLASNAFEVLFLYSLMCVQDHLVVLPS